MRTTLIIAATVVAFSFSAQAKGGGSKGFSYGTGSSGSSHYVAPHATRSGGYTNGHYQTSPNSTRSDNYGSYGNYNFHNGGTGNGYGRSVP